MPFHATTNRGRHPGIFWRVAKPRKTPPRVSSQRRPRNLFPRAGFERFGRPVLFIGPRNATPARLIAEHHCGWQIECGDVGALVSLLRTLNADRSLLYTAGANARQAFLTHYQRKIGVTRIAELLGVQPAPAEAVDLQPLAPV